MALAQQNKRYQVMTELMGGHETIGEDLTSLQSIEDLLILGVPSDSVSHFFKTLDISSSPVLSRRRRRSHKEAAPSRPINRSITKSFMTQPTIPKQKMFVVIGGYHLLRRGSEWFYSAHTRNAKVKGSLIRGSSHSVRLDRLASDNFVRIVDIASRATDVLGSIENMSHWIKTPNKNLNGKTPLEMSSSSFSASEVDALLDRIEYGIGY